MSIPCLHFVGVKAGRTWSFVIMGSSGTAALGQRFSLFRVETIAEEEDPFFNVENIPSMWIFQNKC